MLHAQEVTILPEGIRVNSDSISRIGIADDSVCWGLWVPDRRHWPSKKASTRSPETHDHLLISPFEPSSWPVLFRIEIYVKDDKPGTLAAATKPLSKIVNIVWLEAVPAGHHHAILSIVGEDTISKNDGMLNQFKKLSENRRTFRDDTTWMEVHNEFAKHLLKRSQKITEDTMSADLLLGEKGFLREMFLPPGDERFERGVLYSVSDLPESVSAIGEEQATPAVKCTWLQNLAFFWLYGREPGREAIEFRYNSSSQTLIPNRRDRPTFRNGLKYLAPPMKIIGSFHHAERFVRLVISPEDFNQRTARVTIPYDAKFDPPSTTQGFQHKLFEFMMNHGINLRHVSMFNQQRTLDSETGRLSLLVSNSSGSPFLDIKELKHHVNTAAEA